ncbi:MAG: TolC family protein [Magnetococcales bacterium]|nr:TolC family protein [Magnetococcales bacterium]
MIGETGSLATLPRVAARLRWGMRLAVFAALLCGFHGGPRTATAAAPGTPVRGEEAPESTSQNPNGGEAANPGTPHGLLKLTIAKAIEVMLERSPPTEIAFLRRQIDKKNFEVAMKEFDPRWTVTAGTTQSSNYNRTNDTRDASANSRTGLGATMKVPLGGSFVLAWGGTKAQGIGESPNDVGITYDLSYTQPLLRGAGTDVGLANQVMAQRSEVTSLLTLKGTLIGAVSAVIQACRALMLNKRQLEISQNSLERSRDLLRINKALVEAGRMPAMDLVQVEGDLASRELALRAEENRLDNARITLLQLLGLDIKSQIDLATDLALPEVTLDQAASTRKAFASSPDYLSAEIALDNARTALMLARNGMLWDLALTARTAIAGQATTEGNAYRNASAYKENNRSVDLSLSIPLNDPSREQAKANALVGLRQAEVSLQQLKDTIPLRIQDKIREIQLTKAQIELARRALELTERKLKIEEDRLKAGRSTNFQYLSFQNDLLNAQLNEIQVVVAYQNALDDLESLQGTTLEKWGIRLERDVQLPER